MTAASTTIASPLAGSVTTVGRNIYSDGNRTFARFRVTILDSYATGGVACDFGPAGVTFPIAEVWFTPHVTVANVALVNMVAAYDFVNKKILIVEGEDASEPNGEDLTGLAYDVVVVSE